MSERSDAIKLANELIDDSCASYNEYLLAKELLRRGEVIDTLTNDLMQLQDPMGDMINANRDSILKKHEEAIQLIANLLQSNIDDSDLEDEIRAILKALSQFHPMHDESWQGWPKEST